MTSISEQAERQGEQNKIIGELRESLAAEKDPVQQALLKHRIAGHTAAWWKLSPVEKPKSGRTL